MIGESKRIKFVETSGRKYVEYFKNPSPFQKKCDPSEKCLVCKNQSKKSNMSCRKMGIGYNIECLLCKSRGEEAYYIGESARCAYLRQSEHARALEKKSKDSVLHKHVVSRHRDEQNMADFQMNITGCFTQPTSRIIDEGWRIQNCNPKHLLNSKTEFYGPSIKRKAYIN